LTITISQFCVHQLVDKVVSVFLVKLMRTRCRAQLLLIRWNAILAWWHRHNTVKGLLVLNGANPLTVVLLCDSLREVLLPLACLHLSRQRPIRTLLSISGAMHSYRVAW